MSRRGVRWLVALYALVAIGFGLFQSSNKVSTLCLCGPTVRAKGRGISISRCLCGPPCEPTLTIRESRFSNWTA